MADEDKSRGDEGEEDHDAEGKRDEPRDRDKSGDDAKEKDKGRDDNDGDSDGDGDGDGESKDDGPPIYKKPLFWIVIVVVVLALAIGGFLYWRHARKFSSTDDAYVDAHVVRVAPQVSGVLLRVPVIDNARVVAGQLLAEVEPSQSKSVYAQAVAAEGQAEAQRAQAEAQVVAARATRDKAIADAKAPAAEAEKARKDLARYLELQRIAPTAVAATQIDQARANAKSTAAQAEAARQQIASAAADIGVARKQVTAAGAQVKAAKAKVQENRIDVAYTRIVAPITGHVTNRNVDAGSYVSPGQPMMAIVPDDIWVTANFKETQLTHMRVGQHVRIVVDAYPDVDFEGHVESIQRGAGQAFAVLPPENATGNFVKVVQRVPVRIAFDNPDPHAYGLGPGMSVVPTVRIRD